MSTQLSFPQKVNFDEVRRKQSLGAALELCAEVGGFSFDKTLQQTLAVDKAQFSRWQSGGEGIVWPKFKKLMEVCGNDAPLLWMLHQCGYDLSSLRKLESETERELRLVREERDQLLHDKRVLVEAMSGRAGS
jgi:hypothetical protein